MARDPMGLELGDEPGVWPRPVHYGIDLKKAKWFPLLSLHLMAGPVPVPAPPCPPPPAVAA